MQLIAGCAVDRAEAFIDVGGGASVLVDHLLADGFTNLSILDISAAALDVSRNRLGETANKVRWIESDITEFDIPLSFSVWHDRAVFHFLTETSDRESYVQALKRSLRVGGHLIIAAFAVGGPDQCSGLPTVQYDANKLSAELGLAFQLVEELTEEHTTPANRQQKFAYFHFERIDLN
jgi:SAM-dependent methyltransferase